MSYFIRAKELKDVIDQVLVLDVRKQDEFNEGHIKGAQSIEPSAFSGEGRFFPKPSELAQVLGEVGVDEQTDLVIYDDGSNRLAAKAWVTLYYLGHEKMQILQGGIAAWHNLGGEVTSDQSFLPPVQYSPRLRPEVDVEIAEIKEKMDKVDSVLIDSRGYERYIGKKEPKYERAGHIPGAKNYMSKDVLEHGVWKDREALVEHFSPLQDAEEVIVSCGTGTSACLNFVALKEAGMNQVKIFAGGFKQWIDEGNDIHTDDET